MPMIVDPSAPQITPPTTITSPDGWLTAVVDEQWAGVTLAYNGDTPPTVRNRVLNPSFEATLTTSTSGYGTSSTRSRVTTEAYSGQYSVQHAISLAGAAGGTSWDIDPATDEQTVQAGVWVKIPSGVTALELWWRDSTTNLHTVSVLAQATPGAWQRVTGAYTLAPGQTCNRIAVVATAGAAPVTWWADAAMAEVGDTVHDYVDGSLPGCAWEGAAHASASVLLSSLPNLAGVRKVRITRQDPGAAAPVGVRSGDTAWAIEGVGQAYDHEAPLGVAVVYAAQPLYADGTWGEESALGLTVPAPAQAQSQDLWLKSLETPGLSMRVMLLAAQGTTSAARQESTARTGTPYTAVAYDTAAAPAETVSVDVLAEQIEQFRRLIRSGVLLAQVRPGYLTPDRYFVPGDVSEKPTGKLGSTGGYTVTFDIAPIERPDSAGQPMRTPSWSYDALALTFATYDAVAASYPSYASMATNGAVT